MDSPAATPPLGRFASPWALARQVGRCRIVVSGAYHVAVFALAQGIPVVGLSSSRYYDDKFEGLAAMFGTGLELVRLDGDDVEDRLRCDAQHMVARAGTEGWIARSGGEPDRREQSCVRPCRAACQG